MKTFKCTIHDGHMIIRENGNVILIDTGSPVTIHESNSLRFLDSDHYASLNYGADIPQLREFVKLDELTTLLGTDIIKKYKVLYDLRKGEVSFYDQPMEIKGYNIPLHSAHGIPIINAQLGDETLTCALDSGARLSYLIEGLTRNYKSIGVEEDFYPGLGTFETDCFEISTRVAEIDFVAKYGRLPNAINPTMNMIGANAILGYDFFRNFLVYMDLQNNTLLVS